MAQDIIIAAPIVVAVEETYRAGRKGPKYKPITTKKATTARAENKREQEKAIHATDFSAAALVTEDF